jgi:hypothetical protein
VAKARDVEADDFERVDRGLLAPYTRRRLGVLHVLQPGHPLRSLWAAPPEEDVDRSVGRGGSFGVLAMHNFGQGLVPWRPVVS